MEAAFQESLPRPTASSRELLRKLLESEIPCTRTEDSDFARSLRCIKSEESWRGDCRRVNFGYVHTGTPSPDVGLPPPGPCGALDPAFPALRILNVEAAHLWRALLAILRAIPGVDFEPDSKGIQVFLPGAIEFYRTRTASPPLFFHPNAPGAQATGSERGYIRVRLLVDTRDGIVCEFKHLDRLNFFDWRGWFAARLEGQEVPAPRLATLADTRSALRTEDLVYLRSCGRACAEGKQNANEFSAELLRLSFRHLFMKSDLEALRRFLTAPPRNAEIVQQLSLFYKHVCRDRGDSPESDSAATVRELANRLRIHVTEGWQDREARRNLALVLQE
jgi:hypothetical protein